MQIKRVKRIRLQLTQITRSLASRLREMRMQIYLKVRLAIQLQENASLLLLLVVGFKSPPI